MLTSSSIALEFGRSVLGPLSNSTSASRPLPSFIRTRSERTQPPSLGELSTRVMRVPVRGGKRRERWNAAERPVMPPPTTAIDLEGAIAFLDPLLKILSNAFDVK